MLSVKINRAFVTTIIITFSFIVQAMAQNSRLDSLLDSARQLRITGEMTRAIAKYRESLGIAEKNSDSLTTANSLIGIGVVHEQSGRFETALENYFRALDIYQ